MIYSFDGHLLNPARRELRRGAGAIAIEPQVFDLLLFLIVHRERVVSKDELLAHVWKGRIVSESTLSSRIAALRQAIGDSGDQQRLVRTIARRGFRFVGEVEQEAETDLKPSPGAAQQAAEDAVAKPAAARAPTAERRPVTVLTCRMVGMLELAMRLDPEELRDFNAEYCGRIAAVVERHGGFIARHGNDGVMAFFGYPRANEDDAEKAVRAGLEATGVVGTLNKPFLHAPVEVRVGIATGLVVVEEVQAGDANTEHTVIGDTPHLAATLLESGDGGTVVISSTTRQLVGNLFEYRDLGHLAVTGTTEPVRAWQVLRDNRVANRFDALRPIRAPLLGREEELEMLQRRWDQARTGEGRVVLIWGEPGIGKSRLVAALHKALEAETHTTLRYFCSPQRTQTALHPVVAQLEAAAGFAPSDSGAEKLDKLAALLPLFEDLAPVDLALFAGLLSIPTGDRCAPLSISSERRKELLLERFIAQVSALAARSPLLMVLEDAHWVDPTTREWFDVVIDGVRALPILFVMTYRPEFVPSWLGQSHVTGLTLNRLGRRANASLIKHVAGDKDIPLPLLEQIMTQADGVPLYIEEVTKSVLESGLLREADGGYELVRPLPALAVPPSLQASLLARIDRLDGARILVQTCATLGRTFTYEVLKAVMAMSDAELGPLLDQLVATDLVHQRGSIPTANYSFKHALIQDAAYETMLKSQRAQVHSRIIDVYEHDFPELPERHPEVLAHHCRQAGLAEKAIDYAISAARMSLARSAGVEAQAQVEEAMTLLPAIETESVRGRLEGRLQVAMADATMVTKGFASPEVKHALLRARALLNEAEEPMEALRALCGLFNFHLMRSESPACLDLAVPLLERDLDRPTRNVVQYLAGAAHLHIGNFGQSIGHLETALSLYDENVSRPVAFVLGYHLRSFTLIWLGLGYLYVGSRQRAKTTMACAVDDARTRAHPFTLVSALLANARFRLHVHDLKGAIDATEEGLAIATEQRSPYHVSRANILRAVNFMEMGQVDNGIKLMERSLTAHRETGANFQSSYNLSRLAEAYARAGRFERAIQLADEAVAEVSRTGERWWEAESERLRGEILLAALPDRRDDAVERCFSAALACARQQGARLWEIQASQSLARLYRAQGRDDEAQQLLSPLAGTLADDFDIAAGFDELAGAVQPTKRAPS